MKLSICPECTAPIPNGRSVCPHCGTGRGPVRQVVHVAAVGAALLGLVACDSGDKPTDTEESETHSETHSDEPEYGVSATESETETHSDEPEYGVSATESEESDYGVSDTDA